jgi:hypothetical protein
MPNTVRTARCSEHLHAYSGAVPGTWYVVWYLVPATTYLVRRTRVLVPGIRYLVPEHLFGKSEHLFVVFARLFVFGEQCSGSTRPKIRTW